MIATGVRPHRPAESLYEILAIQAERDADAVAILAPRRAPLSFGALLDQIDHIRTTLNSWSLGRGDRIALLAGRGPDTAVAALGIASCAVCTPLNAAATSAELEQGLLRLGAKALLVPEIDTVAVKDLALRLGVALLEYSVEPGAAAGIFRIPSGRAAASRGSPTNGDLAFILSTSGTTARAKLVPVTHNNVIARTEKSRRLFNLSEADCCLNLMPLCYQHGLNSGLMSPLAAGCAVICPPAFDQQSFFACMREFSPTWYTASFSYHRAILEWLQQRPDALAGHRLRFARAGSGPLSARVRVELEQILGTPVLEIYGATETGTIAANPPVGTRKPGTVGRSVDDDIAIMDGDGHLLAKGMVGEVVVRGNTVFGGYEDDLDTNRRIFREGWYCTGDRGVMDADGYLKLIGRLDEVINRGGEKVSPREIDEALLSHDAVAQAVSFPVPHPTLNQEIAAAVVLRSGAYLTEDKLRRFLADRLAPFKVPRVIVYAAELPKGPTGKVGRAGLAGHFGIGQAAATDPHDAATELQQTLAALWRDVLKRQDIGYDDNFFLCGGDSFSAFDLMLRIEEKFQHQLPLTILVEAPTVRQLAHRLETTTTRAINSTIHIHTAGSRRPLFAVYSAGDHALALLPILQSLGPDQPCYWLQPPGLDFTSTDCTTLPQIAAYCVSHLKEVQPHGPYRLLGSGFGGNLVFEMALQLQETGERVEFLAVVDTEPSTCVLGDKRSVRGWRSLPLKDAPVSSFEAVTRSIREAYVRMTREHVLDSKTDRDIFRGELTFFHSTGNPIVAGQDRRRLWQSFASRFRLLLVPGAHGTPNREPQYTALRNLLRACLNDEAVTGCDPATVYERDYRMDDRYNPGSIVGSMGEVYRIDQGLIQGFVDEIRINAGAIQFGGWAVEPCRQQPAQTIAVFLDDQLLGYGASADPRPDVVKSLSATTALFSGFNFIFYDAVAADTMRRPRLFVLSNDGSAAELRAAIEPVTIGSIKKLSNTEHLGVILAGNWSSREEWGVWSSGRRASIIFDASLLPEHFTVSIRANLFPPGPSPIQTIRVCDESGSLLTTISNEHPSSDSIVRMQKSLAPQTPWMSLIFDIDAATSPQELAMGEDRRKLGIGLISLTFQEREGSRALISG